ncbi:MAG TPA: hypothetical protein VFQ85_00585 [Mycobacteriales bacterium]|jgi:hypothetical protein|nr:hypothetical protein [Mycobacteriales bacterium]
MTETSTDGRFPVIEEYPTFESLVAELLRRQNIHFEVLDGDPATGRCLLTVVGPPALAAPVAPVAPVAAPASVTSAPGDCGCTCACHRRKRRWFGRGRAT